MPPPQQPKKKTDALVEATAVLSRRVGALADAVQINNYKIDTFQKEINRKPDDTEIKWLDKEHDRRRITTTRKVISGVVLSVCSSGIISYHFSNSESKRRCFDNLKKTNVLVQTVKELDPDSQNPVLQRAIHNLEKLQVKC